MENDITLKPTKQEESRLGMVRRMVVQYRLIEFRFPNGFSEIPVIEQCRAYRALDLTKDENFDLMYDIAIQMMLNKPCEILMCDDNGKNPQVIEKFIITDRYMDLNRIDLISEYPCLMEWLVERIAEYLSKKFPHSLKEAQDTMSARKK